MPHTLHNIKYIFSAFAFSSRGVSIKMGCLSWKYQLLCLLLSLLFHSPSSFSSSLSSISPCSALLQFNNSLFIHQLLLFIHLEFRCVILHIQRQPLGRRIRTAVLGMASCVTKPHAMLLALTLVVASLIALFIPTVASSFFAISGAWISLGTSSITP